VRRALSIAAVACGVMGVWAASALGTTNFISASNSDDYDAPDPDIIEGQAIPFNNNDAVSHTVTADETGPDGKPLFRTGTTPGMTTRDVSGTVFLSDGLYDFHCSIHPNMQATLTVFEVGGEPVSRPEISLKVKSKKLERVVKSEKLKVKVEAAEPTFAENVSLTAKKGQKRISKRLDFNLAAGGSRTAKLKLKGNAVEKLGGLEKAKVKVQGSVDFGFGDKASRKLK
jgi:plastocyanin